MNLLSLKLAGTSRCGVPARAAAGGMAAPLNGALTAQRAVPTLIRSDRSLARAV